MLYSLPHSSFIVTIVGAAVAAHISWKVAMGLARRAICAGAILAAVCAASWPGLPDAFRLAGLLGSFHLFIAALAPLPVTPARTAVSTTGHGCILLATVLAWREGPTPDVILAWTVGMGLVGVATAGRKGLAEWRAPLSIVGAFAVGSAILLRLAGQNVPLLGGVVVALALAQALATLLSFKEMPQRASAAWLRDETTVVLAHGLLFVAAANGGLILLERFSIVGARLVALFVAAVFAVSVFIEYRLIAAARRRGPPAPAPDLADPVTLVVCARDDALALRESLDANLALPKAVRFLVVASNRSSDDTVEVARAATLLAPDRVQLVVSEGTSKAEDLSRAWAHLSTSFVLLLDADETIDAESLARGLSRLKSSEHVGVVQGRKVSRTPNVDALGRFINAERRHSTGLDQPFHAEAFGSAHFAGSGALIRREVGDTIGWTNRTLTEDIEFTLRLYVDGRWRIEFEPHMVVREDDPATMRALLRQRTRWARGWMQCTRLFAPEVWRKRRALGKARTFGLSWLMFAAVSAPLATLFPALLVLRMTGSTAPLHALFSLPLAVVAFPARFLGYACAARADRYVPLEKGPRRLLGLMAHAYAWIPLTWFIQLHALALELSSAVREWNVTHRRSRTVSRPRQIAGGEE